MDKMGESRGLRHNMAAICKQPVGPKVYTPEQKFIEFIFNELLHHEIWGNQ